VGTEPEIEAAVQPAALNARCHEADWPVAWFVAFSLTDARFETAFLAASPDNPFADTATGSVVLSKRLSLIARITHLLDCKLSSFGTFGEASDVLGPAFDNPRLLVPAAPRAYSVGRQIGH
jgi:hypothetical protein